MKYEVGDRVKVREDLKENKVYGEYCFIEEMDRYRGKIVTIKKVFSDYYAVEESSWKFTDEMIEEKTMKDIKIADINIIVPNKVVEVLFSDGLKEKMVCHEEDTFDLRDCLFIAISKHLYKKEYTFEGIEYKANELRYIKKYVKIVDSALKDYYKEEEEKKKLTENAEKAKVAEQKKKAKIDRRKAKRRERQRNARISEMVEAYVNAIMICNELCLEEHECECNCECDGDCSCGYECCEEPYPVLDEELTEDGEKISVVLD